MKKLIILFFLSFLPFAFTYSQTGGHLNLENIFKVHALKIKFETVQYFHEESKKEHSFIRTLSKRMWFYYFTEHIGITLNFGEQNDSILHAISEEIEGEKRFSELLFRYVEEHNCSPSEALKAIGGNLVPAKRVSEEELNSYIEQMGTPKEAYKEYLDFVKNIKLEKEKYLKCIDEEIAKDTLSEYAKDRIAPYDFLPPGESILPPGLTKLEFLKVFKEFVINDDYEALPDYIAMHVYLKCNCIISPWIISVANRHRRIYHTPLIK